MTGAAQKIKNSKEDKSDETLLKDAKERIMRLQKKTKKNSATEAEAEGKTTKKTRKYINKRGVVYIGHLPHGFYEEELKKFFSQFGEVSRVKVSRSCRTGKSKGYAFIEFAYNDVAKIVAKTMNNYLMFERLVKAQYIPPGKVHSKLFPVRLMTPESYPTLVRRNRLMAKQEEPSTEMDKKKNKGRVQFKVVQAVKALKELGIDHHPQIYDPEAGRDGDVSFTNGDEVPQLVEIQTATTISKNKPSKKIPKATKKDDTNAKVKPAQGSTPTKPAKVTADEVSVQPTTPETTSSKLTRNQRRVVLRSNKTNAIEVKSTPDSSPAAPTKAEVLKLEHKVTLKKDSANISKESSEGKRKIPEKTKGSPAANVADSQSPSKRSKSTIKSPVKAADTPSKKHLAKPSIQPEKTTGMAKSKTLVKAAAPSKLPVFSAKGKKRV